MNEHTPPLRLMIWNVVSVQVGWFACVIGAAQGFNWFGPVVVAALVVIHLALVAERRRELATLAAAGLFGYAIDSLMVLASIFDFPAQARLGAPSTVWMVALWVNFATALNVALYWLQRRPASAALLGAIGGPMAYYGGTVFGALLAPAGATVLIAGVAIQWALATPLVMAGARHIGRWADQPVPADTLEVQP